ncbi:MAG: MBL fold metallo-hydrolase [Deltaproteobacteria bacterium]|nr:MBL fold metallo-hydrolase [Deltaproteobacteria bacterium]MBW2009489.1 MBL fold metallo-hydrolase [Deltaproteobacteria bacterium]
MVEQVYENIHRIEVPLPKNPLKAVNSYVIRDPERNLVIDTGLNRKECRDVLLEGLRELGVDPGRTDFFITHLHADHSALALSLAGEGAVVYFNGPDYDRVAGKRGSWDDIVQYAGRNGFPEDELEAALKNHPGYKYGSKFDLPLTLLSDGDVIEAGGFRLQCVETPGHTWGHLCLYEARKRILFSGDHILGDITPNIQLWSDRDNPLEWYLESLERVDGMEVDLVLPGHRRIFQDCHGRIRELKEHHRARAEEILGILGGGTRSAFMVAAEMTWDIDCDNWDDFPVSQKWFATGEAIAHLKYLTEKGKVRKEDRNGIILYSLADG